MYLKNYGKPTNNKQQLRRNRLYYLKSKKLNEQRDLTRKWLFLDILFGENSKKNKQYIKFIRFQISPRLYIKQCYYFKRWA